MSAGSGNFTISNVTVSNTRAGRRPHNRRGKLRNCHKRHLGQQRRRRRCVCRHIRQMTDLSTMLPSLTLTVNNQLLGSSFQLSAGDNIVFRNVTSELQAPGAALYIAAEKEWNTRGNNIQSDGAVFTGSNTASKLEHSQLLSTIAIVVYNSAYRTQQNSNISSKTSIIADTNLLTRSQTSHHRHFIVGCDTKQHYAVQHQHTARWATPFRALGASCGCVCERELDSGIPFVAVLQNSIDHHRTAPPPRKVAAGSVTTVHTGMPKTVVGGNVTVVTPTVAGGHTTVFRRRHTCSPANMCPPPAPTIHGSAKQ